MPEKVTDFDIFVKKWEDSEIPGYLFSVCVEQENSPMKVKPRWQVDVCLALPDHRRGGREV